MDPRANSPELIKPPWPLPYVSRRSLRIVTGSLPIPTNCPYCASMVRLVRNDEIYGRSYGDWPYAYLCSRDSCRAHVGLHPHTDIPLGTMADRSTRYARKVNKALFYRLKDVKGWPRKAIYHWLANRLGIRKEECHWGWFDEQMAYQAGEICRQELENPIS